jgi:hypothetical protein
MSLHIGKVKKKITKVKNKRNLILNYLFHLQDLHVDLDSITCKAKPKTRERNTQVMG